MTFTTRLVAGQIVAALQGGWVSIKIATGIVGVLVAILVMDQTLWTPGRITASIERATSATTFGSPSTR